MADEVIIGTELINGNLRLGHTYYEVDILRYLINKYQPRNFVEIGVHEGGLSYLLIPEFYEKLSYYGIELNCQIVRDEVKVYYNDPNYHARLVSGDCFSDEMTSFVAGLPNKMIYCDGGHKALELVAYAKTCKSGDLLFSHDYFSIDRHIDKGLPNVIFNEVNDGDISFLESDPNWIRLIDGDANNPVFDFTRIIGFRKL